MNCLRKVGYLLTAIELSEGGLDLGQSTVQSDLVEIYNEGNAELAWLLHQLASGKPRTCEGRWMRHSTVAENRRSTRILEAAGSRFRMADSTRFPYVRGA